MWRVRECQGRHAAVARQRAFSGWRKGHRVFGEIREFLERQTRLQPVRHQRNAAAALLSHVGGGQAD